MNKIIFLACGCAMTLACQVSANNVDIEIGNGLSNCFSIKNKRQESKHNILLLNTEWDVHKNIGNCGCKSALFSYRVIVGKQNKDVFYGLGSSINRNKFSFILSSDKEINYKPSYKLEISCAN